MTQDPTHTANDTETSFRTIVERYKDQVYNTVLGFVQNTADAEDLCQEVFIKAYEKLDQFRGEASIGTWLYRIAVTHAIDHTRKMKRRRYTGKLLQLFGGSQDEEIAELDHPGVLAERREDARILFKAIGLLPEKQRTAFLLQKTEGLSQQQIAAVMEMNEGAVESLLSRAKQNLRKTLSKYMDHEQ